MGEAQGAIAADDDEVVEAEVFDVLEDVRSDVPGIVVVRESSAFQKLRQGSQVGRVHPARMEHGSAEAVDGAGVGAVERQQVLLARIVARGVEMAEALPAA